MARHRELNPLRPALMLDLKRPASYQGGDPAGAFSLLGSADIASGYANEAGASVAQLAPGSFRATAPVNGAVRFYRIQR